MVISLDDYGRVRERIDHPGGGRFDLCCSHLAGQTREKEKACFSFTTGCCAVNSEKGYQPS